MLLQNQFSAKILTLAVAQFLFFSVGTACEFAIVPFYCPLRKKSYSLLSEQTDTHICQYIHYKDLNSAYHYITMPR